MAARDPFRGHDRYNAHLFRLAINELRRSGSHLRSASRYLDRVADELGGHPNAEDRRRLGVAEANRPSRTRRNPARRPKRTGFVFPKSKTWPIGNRYHAQKAIEYMKAGRGVTLDYPGSVKKFNKIREAIRRRWSTDLGIRRLLRDLPPSTTLVNRVKGRRAAKRRGRRAEFARGVRRL